MSRAGDRHRAHKKRCLALKRWRSFREFQSNPEIQEFLEIYRDLVELRELLRRPWLLPIRLVGEPGVKS